MGMRLILMHLYGWSPDTFHAVWNASNCDIYVLKKNLNRAGFSPYELSTSEGDTVMSSVPVHVHLKTGEKKQVTLKDYLSLPQQRTRQFATIKKMLQEQHGIDPEAIADHGIDMHAGKFSKYK